MKRLRKNFFKILSFLQIGLGLFLIILEIRDYIILPTTLEVDAKYGGVVDLIKYKENTYWLIPLWLLLIFSGISYYINFENERISFFGADSPYCKFESEPVELHHIPRPKKTEYKLNKKKVREKCSAFFGLRQSKKFLAFYSISFPQNFPDEFAYKCFNTVLTRLRRECGLKSYLWVAERQKNGTIHFHMLTNTYIYIKKVNSFMGTAINTQIRSKKNKGKIKVNFDIRKYNGVDVRHVNNNRKALNCYLTKYVSKNTASFHRLPYYSSHDISELFTAETFTHENCSDFRPIRDAIKHIKTFVVDNEYCTIEYLCQKQDNGKFFNPPDSWYWLRDYLNEQIYKNHYAKMKFDKMPLS